MAQSRERVCVRECECILELFCTFLICRSTVYMTLTPSSPSFPTLVLLLHVLAASLPSTPTTSFSFPLFFFFFCVRCDDRAKSSGQWLLGSPPSAVVWQLAPRAWCPLQCLLAKTVGVLSPGVGRTEECAQEFAPQSHIHSGLNQQDLVSSDVFLAHSSQYADGTWWFGSSCQGC